MKSAVIIGGGPAGCQCALWLKMLGYEVVIVEKTQRLGGLQCRSPYINNWLVGTLNLQGQEIAKNIQLHIEQMKIPVFFNAKVNLITKIKDGFEVQIGNETILTHNIVIATGVIPKRGSLHAASNVIIGPGKEVSEAFFTQERVAVLGGGDNAAENYSFIKEKRAQDCHIYARTIKARHSLWSKIDSSDIFIGEYKIDQNTMTILHQGQSRTYDKFVVLYGWKANIPGALSALKNEIFDKRNFVITDEKRKTNVANIFAAGEVTQRVHPCVSTAMADGVIVAKAIQSQLKIMETKNTLRSKL